jgi:hypothetical protein
MCSRSRTSCSTGRRLFAFAPRHGPADLHHPAGGNIEWRQVKSLLEAVGAVTEEHSGKLRVTLGDETEVFEPPHGKDIDKQMIVDLRRMLSGAGLAPAE